MMLENRPHRNSAPYPVEVPIQYRIQGGTPIVGHGRSVSVGRAMICFRCDRPLPVNRRIQLAIDWPAALPGGAKLNLRIVGMIRRCESDAVEVRVETYEFKTRRAAQPRTPPPMKRGLGARVMTGGAA